MNNQTELLNPNFVLKANQPLLLDDPTIIWKIQSGIIGLFAVEIKDGSPISERKYLFSLSAGEALFAINPDEIKSIVTSNNDANQPKIYGILAVPLEEANLSKITQTDVEERIIDDNSNSVKNPITKEFITLAETWIEKFSVFPGVINPSSILDISDSYDWNQISQKLSHLHKDFFYYLDKLNQAEKEEIRSQFEAREQLNSQVTSKALGDLVSIISKQNQNIVEESTELLMAAGAVGRTLGVQINAPSQSEDTNRIKEPIEAIARASRLRMRRVILTPGWWKQDSGALIAYVNDDNKRPVALLPAPGNKYEVFDPSVRKRIPAQAFLKKNELDPIAFMLYRPFPGSQMKAIDVIKFATKGRTKDILVLLVTGVAATLLGMLTPQATGIIIDQAIPDADRGLLLQIGLGLLATSFGSAVAQITQSYASLRLETSSDANTQAAIWDRLLNLRMSFFRTYSIGDLQSRVSAVTQIRQHLSSSTLQTIFTSFFSILNLGLLFTINVQLALVAMGIGIVVMIVTAVSGVFTRRAMLPLEELQGDISGLLIQLIGSVSKLRIAGAENRAFAVWSSKYTKQLRLTLSTQLIEDLVAVFNIIVPSVSNIIIFALTSNMLYQASTGAGGAEVFTAGKFLAFNSAFGTFMGGATGLSNTLISTLEVVVLWERAKPILHEIPEIDVNKADPGKLSGKLELEHVCFRYKADGPWNLDNVSIKAEAGEFIAFVGPSGSGKSTIIRLLLGFDTPELGTVYFDGQDLSGLDTSAIRRQLGVVLQNGRINSASIFENISGGALVTIDEAWEAARMAGFADDIQAMPMGMHTVISEGGTNLSGGQRQRLLIARSLVLKPKILIFDEATSALDNRTQAIVSESLDKLRVTRVVIAHRLSTIKNADRIYVIEAGRVVQQGSYDELASQEGLFANLMARQMT